MKASSNSRNLPRMAPHNVSVAFIVPMWTDIISLERNVNSLSPLTLIPQISCREYDLTSISITLGPFPCHEAVLTLSHLDESFCSLLSCTIVVSK